MTNAANNWGQVTNCRKRLPAPVPKCLPPSPRRSACRSLGGDNRRPMQIFRGLKASFGAQPCALTIGNFDGVHLGHQAMLHRLVAQAKELGLASCVLTFSPHPREFFSPSSAPGRICLLRDKLEAIAACGVDRVVVAPFDQQLASMRAEDFVSDVLLGRLGMRWLLIGDDFKFGAKRLGDFGLLEAMASAGCYGLQAMPSFEHAGLRVSSTAVREALALGQMSQAAALLGRPYTISGHVIGGARLGRQLGFPTLNVAFRHARPAAQGIFVVKVALCGAGLDGQTLRGVANLGVRPALAASDVNGGRVLLESYCLDWPAHLGREGGYGKIARVQLLHKLHDERSYEGLAALQAGIADDIQQAIAYFEKNP